MHVGFTVTSPPEHRGLYGCAPVAFASEESSPPGITTAQLVEADELYLSQLNLLRPNASGANASAALAARIRGRPGSLTEHIPRRRRPPAALLLAAQLGGERHQVGQVRVLPLRQPQQRVVVVARVQ